MTAGAKHPAAILTQAQVDEIRATIRRRNEMLRATSNLALAVRYGVTPGHISRIGMGWRWKDGERRYG